MATGTVRIGNGAGFWGDNLDAAVVLAERGRLDYLTLEYLAELTLSIMVHQRNRDPQAGYASDFVDVLERLTAVLSAQPQLRVVTNAGGINPDGCAKRAAEVLSSEGLGDLRVATVRGDDLVERLPQLVDEGHALVNLDTGQPLTAVLERVVSANAYLGAGPIVDALGQQARIVITGRVADASLTVGPAVHQFGWSWDNWDRLAAATVAGHLIECGAQCTGGLWTHWDEVPDLADVGYPIAELADDGACHIGKPERTGGVVNRQTVVEQLLYEIGDPAHYLTPDVDADFTGVELKEAGPDRVHVRGATGRPRPEEFKVSIAYHDGYAASGTLVVFGRDAVAKAETCGRVVLERVRRAGFELDETKVELLGTGACVPGVAISGAQRTGGADPIETVLRIAVRDQRREAVERFSKELAPLVTSGPPGVTGYTGGRPPVRPVLAYWPTTIPRGCVRPSVTVRPAADFADGT